MKDDGVDALFDGIDKNNTIKSINLRQNKITDVGAKLIARKLQGKIFVKHIDLS